MRRLVLALAVAAALLGIATGAAGSTSPKAIGPGWVRVWNNAPIDAQGVVFTFTVACTLDGSPTYGSPFTLTVTGTGYTDRTGAIPNGGQCVVTPGHVDGFVDLSPRNSVVRAGQVEVLTFTQSHEGPGPIGAGALKVWNSAPSDAQSVMFGFRVSCGFDGTPFPNTAVLKVLGTGYTKTLSGLPVGARCRVAPVHVDGFVDLAPKTSVIGQRTEILSFRQLSATPQPGALKVWTNAPSNWGGQDIVFAYEAACTLNGADVTGSPFTLSVKGSGYTNVVTGLDAGTRCVVTPKAQDQFPTPNPKVSVVAGGRTEVLTFTYAWTTGYIFIWNEAPADPISQATVFTFQVTCSVDGPWSGDWVVTGTGRTDRTISAPGGTECKVTPVDRGGYVHLDAQQATVVNGKEQTLRFEQQLDILGP